MNTYWEKIASCLYRFIKRSPYLIFSLGLCLAFLSVLYTKGHLEFWTERNVLISQKNPSAIRYSAYRQEFKDDYLILVLNSKDLEQTKKFASLLGKRLEEDVESIQEAFYRIPLERFQRQALLLLDPEALGELQSKIAQHQELLNRLAASPDLITLLKTVNERISRALVQTAVSGLFSEKEPDRKKEKKDEVDPEDLRVLSSLMDSLYAWLADDRSYLSPWGVFMQGTGGLSEDGYLVDEERGWVFVLAYLKGVEGSFNREGKAIERIRAYISEISEKVPHVSVGITGIPALNSEEMSSSLQDMSRAMGLALLLITILFVIGFGRLRRPLMAVLVLILGIIWTIGWMSLTVGHLTILSMAFGSILIGLGIDFAIHLVARYEKERSRGLGPPEALEATLKRVGRAILSGSLTTAVAFFALGLSSFRGLREFGWVAGWGILFCLVAEMILLPVLLLILDSKRDAKPERFGPDRNKGTVLERVLGWPAHYPFRVMIIAGVLTLSSFFFLDKVRFDYNLLHLQPKGTEAVAWEHKLLEAAGNSSIFAVEMVDSLEAARQRTEQYEKLSLVNRVESLAAYIPADMTKRMEQIEKFKPLLEDVELVQKTSSPPSSKRVRRYVAKIRFKLRKEEGKNPAPSSESQDQGPPPETIAGARFRLEQVLSILESSDTEGIASALARYQERLFADFNRKITTLKASIDPLPITFEELPTLLKKRFFGKTGKWLLQIYPKEDIWELEPQKRFVKQLRAISPEITGPAVVNYEATKSLLDAYIQGGLFAVCAILIILIIDFRHPLLVLLTLVPLVVASLWTLLGMQVFEIAFNPANLVIIPLLVGIGVDNGIHVIRHFLGSLSSESEIAGTSMGRAITLSSLTTMAGFGSLAIARHQGIHSIGALLTLAMASCLLASLVVLPSILRLLPERTRNRIWRLGQSKTPTGT